jgi:YVTN family beta-propeller protein
MVLAENPVGTSTPPPEGGGPNGVAVSPDGSTVYVANFIDGTVSVIATATDTVTATIPVGSGPLGVAVTPDGSTVYVTNFQDNTVSVIATASNTVTATIPLGNNPFGVAVTPDGSTVYVANESRDLGREQRAAGTVAGTMSVIATASNTVTATIPGFSKPIAFGVFIGPPPVLATPPSGTACNGCSTAPSRAR